MYPAFFGSVAVTHSFTVKRDIDGIVARREPGCGCAAIPLDEGVHLHRPGVEVTLHPKHPVATFAVVIC